jgi:putative flippase GtrA
MPILPRRGAIISAAVSPFEAGAPCARVIAKMIAGRPVRFLAVGTAGLAADIVAFWVVLHATDAEWASRLASLAVATIVTWRLNRSFTFANAGRRAAPEALRYGIVAVLGQGFNYAQFVTLRTLAPMLPSLLALIAAAATAAVVTYCGQRFFTFRPLEP